MWKLGNRAVIVLVCVLSGCVILYNIWESVLGVIITLLLVIYACALLLSNDNFQTPHALLVLEYIERAGRELYNLLQNFSFETTTYTAHLIERTKIFYQNHIITRMDRRHRNTYQLSTDTIVNSNKNSEFNMVEGLTPISRNRRRSYITGSENNSNIDSVNSHECGGTRLLNKVTSTPLVQWRKRESLNGDVNHHNADIVANQTTLRRASSLQLNDHYGMSREDETIYSPRGSPWGTSISPKMRPKAAGVKTIQTVSGPLLTSTRYNIDPKVYTDVTSPGLTSRLTKYATEANMKLIHQPQYSAGQFPKVNLNTSPTPIINPRSPRARTSVTVRVAPPDTAQYSPPERQKIVSSMCQTKNKTPPSVAQVLKEISLKRHASRDDISIELAKKQRTDGIYNEELENYEEITQKRGRDDLSKSQEETSIDNILLRPTKRSKMPSCYDILNSLSSSTNVSSGVKRKADISRSGTPDIGKHFKSLDDIQRSRSFSTSPSQNNNHKSPNDLADSKLDDSASSKKLLNSASPKVVSPYTNSLKKMSAENEKILGDNKSPIKLTDRLFMRAEPQNIDKLKSLIEEHASVSSKFTSDDGEEIKKSDVVNMRQTSMKARLQSMFDAISGKVSGQIDPNLVIQAESVNNSTVITTTSSLTNPQLSLALTTLNASTSTTSINTSPISTSAVTPTIGKTKTSTTPGKHVTFLLPTATLSTTNNDKVSLTTTKPPTSLSSIISEKKTDIIKKFETVDTQKPLQLRFDAPAQTNLISMPCFGSVSSTAAVSIVPTTIVSSQCNSSTNSSTPTTSSTPPNIPNLFSPLSTSSPSVIAFGAPQLTSTQKIPPNTSANFILAPAKPVTIAPTTTGYSFGTPTVISTATDNSQTSSTAVTQSTPMLGFQSTTTTSALTPATPALSTILFTTNKPTIPTLFPATTTTTTTSTNSSAATITTPSFSFGQLSSNPSSVQSTVNPPTQGAFSFGATNNSTVNLNAVTTTQTQVSIKPQADPITTPSTFTFGANNLNTTASTFGTNIPSISKSVPVFGSANNSTTITTTGCTPPTTSSSIFSFGKTSATPKPVLSFGTSNNPQTTGINNILTFGTPSQSSASIFGVGNNNNNNNSSNTTTSAQSLPSFGTISTAISQSNTAPGSSTMSFTFGTPNTEQSSFTSTSANVTNTNSNIQLFGVTPKPIMTSTFGMNPTAINTTTNTTNNASISAAITTSASLFNNAGNSNNIFGQSKIMPSTGAFGTSLTTSPNFATTATNNFGDTGQQSLSFGTQQPITTAAGFGTSSSANNMSTSTFGTSNTTTPSAPAPPAFGSSNRTSTGFGGLSSITPNFVGAPTTDFSAPRPTTNLFGTRNLDSTTTFNSTTSLFATGATTTTTTSTAPPAFGTATTSITTFGTSSGFGNTNVQLPTFGSSITNTAFGSGFSGTNSSNPISPFSNQSSSTSTFGSTNTPLPSFGTPSTNNTSSCSGNTGSGSAFSFGNPSTNQSQQQNSPFTFGSANTNNNNNNNNNNPASAATPFQFGAVATPQPGGFNFTGGSPAPSFGGSSAGSSGGGMFSIGSGSTAPRSRSTRPRRQQR